MPTIRVMHVMQGATNLPEDRFVNVFHFHNPTVGDSTAAIVQVCNVLEDALTTELSGTSSYGNFISPYASRNSQLVAYDMLTATPRIPIPRSITLGAALQGGLPEEVACCMSYHGAPPITARRRGRIYVGPLSSAAIAFQPATAGSPAIPGQTAAGSLNQFLIAFGTFLMAESATVGMPWAIRSTRPDENYVTIVGGHVDNAFDTQRRRGCTPSGRTTWGTP